MTRRVWLQSTAAMGALSPLLKACGDNTARLPQVVVVGGGLAGLHCTYRLLRAGVRVRLFESSDRTGGRTFTATDAMPNGHIIELGGELIDTDHEAMQALAEEFGLTLDDLVADTDGLLADTFYIAGQHVSKATILDEFIYVAPIMANAVSAAEADDDEFARVDAMSIPQWLEDEAGLPPNSLLRQLLEAAYLGEYGLEVDEQSIFNLLYLIDYETTDDFLIYGSSDERFHLHQGSQSIANALTERIFAIDPSAIARGVAVTAVRQTREPTPGVLSSTADDGPAYEVAAQTATGSLTVTANHVVFALPFTRLRAVDTSGLPLSDDKRAVIEELGYGTNAKLMMQFSERTWRTEHNASGSSISDVGDLQTTWDTSRGQAGASGVLTNFVGGARGLTIGEGTAQARALEALPWLDTVFPGTSTSYVADSAVRMHWPTHPHTLGSYACYKPTQWAYYGLEGERVDNIHFAGEHCSLDFQGYMEGAAETGLAAATEILDQYDVSLLSAALPNDSTVPRWAKVLSRQVRRDTTGRRLRRLERRRAIVGVQDGTPGLLRLGTRF